MQCFLARAQSAPSEEAPRRLASMKTSPDPPLLSTVPDNPPPNLFTAPLIHVTTAVPSTAVADDLDVLNRQFVVIHCHAQDKILKQNFVLKKNLTNLLALQERPH